MSTGTFRRRFDCSRVGGLIPNRVPTRAWMAMYVVLARYFACLVISRFTTTSPLSRATFRKRWRLGSECSRLRLRDQHGPKLPFSPPSGFIDASRCRVLRPLAPVAQRAGARLCATHSHVAGRSARRFPLWALLGSRNFPRPTQHRDWRGYCGSNSNLRTSQ